jgi:hypothetical protein
VVWIVARSVQDGYADEASGIHCVDCCQRLSLTWWARPTSRVVNQKAVNHARRTVWVPHFAGELHCWWCKRIVLWELELCWKYSSFKRRALRSLNQSLPEEDVVFGDWACSNAIRRLVGEVFVLLKQALLGDRGSHIKASESLSNASNGATG